MQACNWQWSGGKRDSGAERLTNVRFADDLIIYAKSESELTAMLDMLAEELRGVGLSLNAKKSKIFTSNTDIAGSAGPVFLEAAGDFIAVARVGDQHKYLGCMLSGDLRHRGKTMLQYRMRCAWGTFPSFVGRSSTNMWT